MKQPHILHILLAGFNYRKLHKSFKVLSNNHNNKKRNNNSFSNKRNKCKKYLYIVSSILYLISALNLGLTLIPPPKQLLLPTHIQSQNLALSCV